MRREELHQIVNCVDCGSPVDVARERGYRSVGDWALCWECAIRRGARFDHNEDRWTDPPDLTGLPPTDEQRVP